MIEPHKLTQPDPDQEANEVADKLFAQRLDVVRQRVVSAGGDLASVKLLAVTKTLDVAQVKRALRHGLVDLGENYAQELVGKSAELSTATEIINGDLAKPCWHLIGNVQRNKVRKLASIVSLWQTVDRIELGREIAKRAPGARVLVQVNTTDEQAKSGAVVGQVPQLVEELSELGLKVEGLMTVGPTDSLVDPSRAFARLAELGASLGLKELSMGMSGDIERAVENASTMIRVGTALFGPRDKAN